MLARIIIALAVLILAAYSIRRPSLPLALMIVGFPLILLARYYTQIEWGGLYFAGLFALYGVLCEWLRRPSLGRLNTPFFWLFIAIAGMLLLGTVGTPAPESATFKILYFLGAASPLIVGGTLLTESQRRMDEMLLILGIVAICTYVAHIFFIQFGSINPLDIQRYSELGNPIFVARSVGMGVLAFTALSLNRRFRVALPVWLGAIAVGLYIMIYTASRGPLLAIAAAFVCGYVLRLKRGLAGVIMVLIVAGIAHIVLQQFVPLQVYERLTVHNMQDPLGARGQLMELGIEAGQANPVFGVGTAGYGYELNGGDVRDYPHNMFVELFAEHGVVGIAVGLAMAALMVVFIIKGVMARRYLGRQVDFVIAVVVYGFINAQFSGDLPGQYELWLGIGMLAGIVRQGNAAREQQIMLEYEEDLAGELLPAQTF